MKLNILEKIKYFFQRGKNGFTDLDKWNINSWFSKTIVDILKAYQKQHMGYPATTTKQEWDNVINEMIKCFTEMTEEGCSIKNEYDMSTDTENLKKWVKRENEIYEYRNNMKNKGLELFSKYFWELWD